FLAFVARGLDETALQQRQGKAQSSIDETLIQRGAATLDSLAYVLVSRPQNQVVAVGARVLESAVPDEPGIIIFATENQTPVPGLIEHLQNIFTRLQRVHALLPPQPTENRRFPLLIAAFLPSSTKSDFERELINLELSILVHAWKTVQRRFQKEDRHLRFLATARDICGPPAQSLADLDIHA
ncbi:hypothetical protein B0H17DRAFT_846655, partial [Mycena rosella]